VADAVETHEFLQAAAYSDGLVAGVVGWVDLTADAATALDELLAGESGARLVGVRHPTPAEPDPDWLARPDVSRGLRDLADRGLVFDLLVTARELPAALVAVDAVDDLSFVVDHGAKPPIAAGEFEPWRELLREVGERPHVTCKVSGLVTEANWASWTPAALQPYVDTLLEIFGPTRLMWGSDWPVCTVAASYADVLASARSCLSSLSAHESHEVFAGTACRVYGLPVGPGLPDGRSKLPR
ncbi:MAG: amidohydrolase family protein, partial [Mycobacteriales bacterium]